MSRILLVWELGGNLGHVTRLLALAKALRQRGHHVLFALRDTRLSEPITKAAFTFVQAPAPRSSATDLPREPVSYPEILFHCGFADPATLTTALRAWRQLYRKLAPDLIVFDHAPIALLAARGTGISRVVFGTGFASPPRVSPMPSIRPWQQIPIERLRTSEQCALDTANAALRAIGSEPMDVFHELFDVEENVLATLPELDHYRPRANVRYWGPVFDNCNGAEPSWPKGEGKKLFVYIRPNSPVFRPLVATLRNANTRTLWFAPGLTPNAIAELKSPSLEFARDPVGISAVSASADAAILHGGHGTTAAMLLGGVPVLLLPEYIEQLLLGRNVAALGAGAALNARSIGSGFATILERLIHDARYAAHAKTFAAKCKLLDQNSQPANLLARLETLLTGIAVDRCLGFDDNSVLREHA